MAIIPSDTYPGQTDTSDLVAYPSGAAQNVIVIDDGVGFPLEKTWVNDLLGWQQALLAAAGITASGDPDTAVDSQYKEAIEWIAEGSRGFYNVTSPAYGALGNGSADDTAAIQDAIDACAVAGGVVFLPAGRYRLTAELSIPPGVHLFAYPGTVVVTMDHATARTANFAGVWDTQTQIFGIDFEADQANTGTVFFAGSSTGLDVKFIQCRANFASLNLTERIWQTNEVADKWTAEDCIFIAVRTGIPYSVSNYHLIRGDFTMAPGATGILFPVGVTGRVEGTTFRQVSIGGNVAFLGVGAGGVLSVEGAVADVDDSGAGAASYLISSSGGRLYAAGNRLRNNAVYYLYSAIAAEDSDAELLPLLAITTASAAAIVQRDYGAVKINCSNANPPTITLEDPLFDGQPLDFAIQNTNGGGWTGDVVFSGSLAYTPAITNLGSNSTASVRFIAVAGAWTPIGALGTYAP